jgi:hypothetical protein
MADRPCRIARPPQPQGRAPLLHELKTYWPELLALIVIFGWHEYSRRADFKRHVEHENEIKAAYQRGRLDAQREDC